MHVRLIVALALTLLATPAWAKVSLNYGSPGGGSIRPGDDSTACASGIAGAIRYNSGVLQYCDGSAWTALGGGGSGSIDDLTDAISTLTSSTVFLGSGGGSTNTGNFNTGVGINALAANTSGYNNTANGSQSLRMNTVGFDNTAIGYQALYTNVNGTDNTSSGYQALYSNNNGAYNVANGAFALRNNTSGTSNAATGYFSLRSNTTGGNNTANGSTAMYQNTIGAFNTANGASASYNNVGGRYNTANGFQALYNNTGGLNLAEGANAAFGGATMVVTGTVALGAYSGYSMTTNTSNTLVGTYAGYDLTTGSNNILLGTNVRTPAATTNNYINIGNTIYGDSSFGSVGIGTAPPAVSGSLNVAGNVGIGTINPNFKLHIAGTNPVMLIQSSDTNARSAYMQVDDTNGLVILGSSFTNGGSYPIAFKQANTELMRIQPNGNVGIGTTAPQGALEVSATDGNHLVLRNSAATTAWQLSNYSDNTFRLNEMGVASGRITVKAGGNVGIGTTAPSTATPLSLRNSTNAAGRQWVVGPDNGSNFLVYNDASAGVYLLYGASTWSSNSDRRLKTDITPLPDALARVSQLNGVSFHWKDKHRTQAEQVGVIAQDVEKVYPQLVTRDASGTLSVQYASLVAPLIESVKQLKAENDNLRSRLDRLEAARR